MNNDPAVTASATTKAAGVNSGSASSPVKTGPRMKTTTNKEMINTKKVAERIFPTLSHLLIDLRLSSRVFLFDTFSPPIFKMLFSFYQIHRKSSNLFFYSFKFCVKSCVVFDVFKNNRMGTNDTI